MKHVEHVNQDFILLQNLIYHEKITNKILVNWKKINIADPHVLILCEIAQKVVSEYTSPIALVWFSFVVVDSQ